MRTRPPLRDGKSSFFGHVNSGKKFLCLDLKKPEAIDLIKKLIAKSDILIEAFRPGVMKKFGLDAEVARQINPAIIYCSISGFGQNGELSGRPAYAPIVHASSGYYMANYEYQDSPEKPPNSGIPLADVLTASFAAISILIGLLKRQSNQAGSYLDVSLMDSMMSLMTYEIQAAQFPLPNRRPLYKPLRTLDGFVMVTPINAKNFVSLCTALEHPEWLTDPMFITPKARYDNWNEFMYRIESWTRQRTAAECESYLMPAGVPCARYRKISEAMGDDQFLQRETFAEVEDSAGIFKTANLPFFINGAKPQSGKRVGDLGENTAEVLESVANLSKQEIRTLIGKGTAIDPKFGSGEWT